METCVTRIYTFSFPFTRSNLWRPDEAKRNPVAGSARAESQNLQVSVLKSEAMVHRRTRSPTPDSEGARKRRRAGVPSQQFIGRDESTEVSEECNDEQAPASLLDVVEGEGEGTELTEKCDDEPAPASLLDVVVEGGEGEGTEVTEQCNDEQAPAWLLDVFVKGDGTDMSVDTDCGSDDIEGFDDDASSSQSSHATTLYSPGYDVPGVYTLSLSWSSDDEPCAVPGCDRCREQAGRSPRNGADREFADGE